jgi:DnaJ-class molecular chaperone
MVAVKTTLKAASASIEAESCPDCQGNGTIRYSNEVSYFEDLRTCARCEAGRSVEMRIAEIMTRAQSEERYPRRHRPRG